MQHLFIHIYQDKTVARNGGSRCQIIQDKSDRRTLMRSIENPNLENLPKDVDYTKFLKSLLPTSEPCSSLNEGFDYNFENSDVDPQYKMFLDNSEMDGESYKLEIAMKNGTTSVMYEGKDNSDSDCNLKTIPAGKYAEKYRSQHVENNTGGKSDNVNEERISEPETTKFTSLSPIRDTQMCNKIKDSTKNTRNKRKGRSQKFVEDDPKSRGVKVSKNTSRRKNVETLNIRRNGACDTIMDMENTRGREKRKSLEEKKLKSKCGKHVQANIDMFSSKRSGAKLNGIFGLDWQNEINADDVDECYQMFLNSAKIEGDCAVYAIEGQKPVKQEALDVICSYDSEILVTSNAFEFNEGYLMPENEQQCLGSQGGGFDTQFRTKLMDKLGEPYNGREYKKLWNEFNKEKPKVKHYDLRGPGAVKSFPVDELSPSYNDRYALLSRKIVAAGSELQRLQYLRGFFFWLQNVAHEDAFVPWLDKSCLKVMQ